ncbi:hypothetical protein J4E83_009277 [Alternaria metachromatica]|uniref:uncharacterized protein n=1 Tax=Alternaria metachromatica TaxID=283354 RepID=UPI0020C253FA|nr:uncharacterized protein J4E83_009277 [Alternaria metachromatica]KAI4608094.1 hypothetical protein J4E83_009277 [Alternaria metachromatica]
MVRRGFAADAAFTKKNMITFKVGHGGKAVFLVPEDRIRASSEFVDAAMRGPWQESQERVITLPEFDRDTFGIYFEWLVTGVVHSKFGPADGNDRSIELKNLYLEMLHLPRLCDLGHFLIDTDFRDTLNDILLQCASEAKGTSITLPPSFGSRFYEKTPEGSPTRKLVADLVAGGIEQYHLKKLGMNPDNMHSDYIMDLLLAMSVRLDTWSSVSPLRGWQTSCKYHCHGDEKPCYRKKAGTSRTTTTKRPAPDDTQSPDAKRRA